MNTEHVAEKGIIEVSKSYISPELIVLGTIAELTQSLPGEGNDGGPFVINAS